MGGNRATESARWKQEERMHACAERKNGVEDLWNDAKLQSNFSVARVTNTGDRPSVHTCYWREPCDLDRRYIPAFCGQISCLHV